MTSWTTADFDYELPSNLIAQQPLPGRGASQLLHVKHEVCDIESLSFNDLPAIVNANDLIIFNNTKVFPARFKGKKATGGQIECLIERIISDRRVLAHLKASKAPRVGAILHFSHGLSAEVIARHDALFELECTLPTINILEWLEQHGTLPLPPYIHRQPDDNDLERYQTVFATETGAVAAPTAGLHFDQAMLDQLDAMGVAKAYLTLHVGAGTFQPVRTQDLSSHVMHQEWIAVSDDVCEAVKACQARGGRVIAVGTTVLRALESAAQSGDLLPFEGDTNLFIKPGYSFKVVDALLTNFHLPCSTLLMLVCALGGYDRVMIAYQQAIALNYRFFSYGDCMFIER